MDEAVLKKLSTMKVNIVPLNSPTDFGTWHIALRRLVKGYGMGDALLFSVPEDRMGAFKARAAELDKVKGEVDDKRNRSSSSDEEEPTLYTKSTTSGSEAKMVAEEMAEMKREEKPETSLLGAMGVTKSMDEFFSATTTFVNVRTEQPDSERDPIKGILKISQEEDINSLLREFGLGDVALAQTPMLDKGGDADMSDDDLPKTDEEKQSLTNFQFRNIIGKIWWLAMISRPDVNSERNIYTQSSLMQGTPNLDQFRLEESLPLESRLLRSIQRLVQLENLVIHPKSLHWHDVKRG